MSNSDENPGRDYTMAGCDRPSLSVAGGEHTSVVRIFMRRSYVRAGRPSFQDADFAPLFAKDGALGVPPWRLALVTILQFHENLSDRHAAEAVRARIDWKYALSLELTDEGFDFSVLSEFRARLINGGAEELL
jgi:hypothetical protein